MVCKKTIRRQKQKELFAGSADRGAVSEKRRVGAAGKI